MTDNKKKVLKNETATAPIKLADVGMTSTIKARDLPCDQCLGKGLLDENTICGKCKGTGKI